jgi:signal transduction histidine kinase
MTIEADEMKLSLAISNLVENGIKYTPDDGMVKVTIDGDHQNAFITVQDTGMGISEEEQAKVFKRFYRVDKTRDRETGGTGLGLAITHSTVMLHNGSIKIISSEGKGATFVVRLPIKHTEG